jgi:starch synthase
MYHGLRHETIQDLHEIWGELWVPHGNQWRTEKVFSGQVSGLTTHFVTCGEYTLRDRIYGYDDDIFRFAYFNRAALEFLFKSGRRPEILHAHDWPAALTPAILYDVYGPLGWNNTRCVFTIHNNECQGVTGAGGQLFGLIGMDVRNYHRPDRFQDDGRRNCVNLMRGGIVYANFVTTVSPSFCGELKTAAGGRGLQHVLSAHAGKFGGVLNGIDYDEWNPEADSRVAAPFSPGDDFIDKYRSKYALREWLRLADAWKPLVSVVTRLTAQKGLDLLKHAIYETVRREGQFALLGSAPDPRVQADFQRIKNEFEGNPDVHLWLGYHEDLAHLMYAGADLFFVPSLFEPCGLTQMIALRYGTVPVVRQTGGLADTVFDVDTSSKGLANANGFVFRDADAAGVNYALGRGLRLWYENPEAFARLAKNGMRYDYSWRGPAKDYENIYNYVKA